MLRRVLIVWFSLALSSQALAAEICRSMLKAYDDESDAAARKAKLESVLTNCASALKASDKTLRNLGTVVLKACDGLGQRDDDKRSCKIDAYRYLLWFQY